MDASLSVQSPDLCHLGNPLEIPCAYQCDPINVHYSGHKYFLL